MLWAKVVTQEGFDELARVHEEMKSELEWYHEDANRRARFKDGSKLRGPVGWLPRCADLVTKVCNQRFNEAPTTADHFLRNNHDLWKELVIRECPPLRFGAEQLGVLGSMGHKGTTALPLYIQTVTAS
jgi:hypothetical protein